MSAVLQWKKYVGGRAGVDLWLFIGPTARCNIARVLKEGPNEYRWFPLGHGLTSGGESRTRKQAMKEAEKAVLDYATVLKVAMEGFHARR